MALSLFRPQFCGRKDWPSLRTDWYWPDLFTGLDMDEFTRVLDLDRDVTDDQNKFSVKIDCSQFKPEDITVTVRDRDVLIRGRHEERSDEHGWVEREFQRRYTLPAECEPDQVVSNLDESGVLVVEAPKKAAIPLTDRNERIVPIEYKHEDKSYLDGIKRWIKRHKK